MTDGIAPGGSTGHGTDRSTAHAPDHGAAGPGGPGSVPRTARSTVARAWFGLTALCVLVALAIQIPLTATDSDGFFTSPASRVANLFFFFTILSNILVGVTTALLALRQAPDGPARGTRAFPVFRFMGVVAIAITGVVYHLLLAGLFELTALGTVVDQLLHTVVPLLAVSGWLLFGPRGQASWRVAVLSLAYPVLWLVVTLIRGTIVDWYPYPFIDVIDLGYGRVLVNVLGVSALFLAVAFGLAALDRFLTGRSARADRPGARPAG